MRVTPRAAAVKVVAEALEAATGVDQTRSGVAQAVFKQKLVRMVVVQQR